MSVFLLNSRMGQQLTMGTMLLSDLILPREPHFVRPVNFLHHF